MQNAIHIVDLSFSHHGANSLSIDQVSLKVAAGESVALLGPSGSGKTTLLTLLDGRLRDWQGRASVLGMPFEPNRVLPMAKRADTGFIFQEFALVERSSVMRNVLNGRLGRTPGWRTLLGNVSNSDMEIARSALSDCDIADLADRRVDSLSGGQRQRVAIARCLAQEPQLILADEPVSNLDPSRAADILTLLSSAAQVRRATTMFSSHQPELARRFADRIIGMRNGRIVFDLAACDLTEDATAVLYDNTGPASGVSQKVES
ncbi:ATP-binding cassette domain-containing protein [Cohaesibacter sp. CAU 1516]|uniref:phosphonate ABC transporter ATP-binding protein n=1 Tax=Cohaesibacter sp. CAU 1516 TaxID=2576038 RepID=UPI0010FDC226|nr:ATP-binding cassette domain-containing protein [Cohaesibacter sp. CAU 1516]TLP45407.1 ATP-binding cassette domain-containing protein [Cohaesibacter sp. CAU 1516]